MAKVVMIQPDTSLTGSVVRYIPIGLLYASMGVVEAGHSVALFDERISPSSWKRDLAAVITEQTVVVGITVTSGRPILDAIRISSWVRLQYPHVKIVWGGPHVTFSPDTVMQCDAVDFAISGFATQSFPMLVEHCLGSEGAPPVNQIPGLSWRADGAAHRNEMALELEWVDYTRIPYHLIEDFSVYRHIDSKEVVFPIYSTMGCPYRCGFCSSPALYSRFPQSFATYDPIEVVDHIEMVHKKYGATLIYFIDDDSFPILSHVESIIDEKDRRGLPVNMGFRGARVNEVVRMNDAFLTKLAKAGTKSMHIGAESGSDRMLSLMNKNITKDETLAINRKLARHPEISVFYNFIVGYPGETIQDTRETCDLILQLIAENPSCYIIPLNKPRPLPGSHLMELALSCGYRPPETLEDWATYEVESESYHPCWLTDSHDRFIRMMFLMMYFIDDKLENLLESRTCLHVCIKAVARMYKPIARYRFRRGLDQFLVEEWAYRLAKRYLPGLL